MALSAEHNEMMQTLASAIRESAGVRAPVDRVADKQKNKDNKKALAAQKELIAVLKKYEKSKKVMGAEFLEIKNAAKKAGVELNEVYDSATKTVKGFDDLQEGVDDLTDSIEEMEKRNSKLGKTISSVSDLYGKHKQKLKEAFGLFVAETRIARERAVYDANYLDAVWELGISLKDWQTILADNRGTQQAMAAAGRDFTQELIAGQKEIVNFSKDNTQAAKTAAQFAKNITGFGVGLKNQDGAMNEQVKMFKDNFQIWGMTAEAFGKSTEALLADTDIRNNLSIMAEKERKQYILGLQAQESYRMELGYSADQARELTKVFAKMAGESPKERMKKAAKQRAMMGALGMGAEGAELQKLMVNINQLQGQEKVDAQARIEEIQRGMSNALQQKYGQGLASEMAFRAMADKTGVTELARSMETLTKEGKVKDKDAALTSMAERTIPEMLNNGMKILDTITAIKDSTFGLLGSILIALTAGPIIGAITSAFGGITTLIAAAGGGLLAGGAAIAGGISTVAATGGAVIAGAGAAASAAALPLAAITGAGAAGYGVGTLINDQLSNETKQNIGSFIGPIIDNVLSFFGSDEAEKRLQNMDGSKKSTEQKTREQQQTQQNESITAALNDLQTYLKKVNGDSSEQVETMNKLGEAVNRSLRFDGFKPRTQ